MKTEIKTNVKKNAATGTSAVAGVTAGAVMGAALSPENVEAADQANATPAQQPQTISSPHVVPTNETEQLQPMYETAPQEPQKEEQVNVEEENNNDLNGIEVIAFDRETFDDGSQMDIATIKVDGKEMDVIDFDLDGKADLLVSDDNGNGILEDNEYKLIEGEGIEMQPFADAVGFSPLFAENDLPDYVNDADVNSYMA